MSIYLILHFASTCAASEEETETVGLEISVGWSVYSGAVSFKGHCIECTFDRRRMTTIRTAAMAMQRVWHSSCLRQLAQRNVREK